MFKPGTRRQERLRLRDAPTFVGAFTVSARETPSIGPLNEMHKLGVAPHHTTGSRPTC